MGQNNSDSLWETIDLSLGSSPNIVLCFVIFERLKLFIMVTCATKFTIFPAGAYNVSKCRVAPSSE